MELFNQQISMTGGNRLFQSSEFPIPALCDRVTLSIPQPSAGWGANSKVEIALIIRMDSEEHRANGSCTGGKSETYRLHFGVPFGYFGLRDRVRRLGERAQSVYTVRFEIRRLSGAFNGAVLLEAFEFPAPTR